MEPKGPLESVDQTYTPIVAPPEVCSALAPDESARKHGFVAAAVVLGSMA